MNFLKPFICCLFLLCISTNSVYTQSKLSYTLAESDVFASKKKKTVLTYTESDNNGGLVTIHAYSGGLLGMVKGYYINHFDADLNLIKSKEVEVKEFDASSFSKINAVSVKKGILNLVVFGYDRKNKDIFYSVFSAPLETMDFSEKRLVTINKKELSASEIYSQVYSESYDSHSGMETHIAFSDNKDFLCIVFQDIYVFNADFEKVVEHTLSIPVENKYFEFQNFSINNDNGTIYALGKVFENESRRSKKKGQPNYHFELYKIDQNGQDQVSFDTEGKFINSLAVAYKNNTLACVGLFSESKDSRYSGSVRFGINPKTFAFEKSSFQPFSEQFLIDKYGKEKDKELRNLKIRDVFMDDKGDIVFNGEEYLEVRTVTQESTHTRQSQHFYFYDIFVIKLAADGQLLWSRNINKSQSTGGVHLDYVSYISSVYDNNVFIIVNADEDVSKAKTGDPFFTKAGKNKSDVFLIALDKDGTIDYESVIAHKKTDMAFKIRYGSVSKDGSHIVFAGSRKKDNQVVKIAF